jgi:hypothetical protein
MKMESYSDPGEEITGQEDIIRLSDVRERVRNIKPWHVEELTRVGDLGSFVTERGAVNFIAGRERLIAVEYAEESDELEALRDLLADFSACSNSSFMVHESYMEDYAQEEAESLDGISPESFTWQFVRWDDAADALKMDMQSTVFRGSTYWIVSR